MYLYKIQCFQSRDKKVVISEYFLNVCIKYQLKQAMLIFEDIRILSSVFESQYIHYMLQKSNYLLVFSSKLIPI